MRGVARDFFFELLAVSSRHLIISKLLMCFRITSDTGWLDSDSRPIAQQTPAQMMENVYNPFVVRIMEPSKASFKGMKHNLK